MAGHLPPSSSVTGVRCFAAAAITTRPTRELPVKKILSNRSRNKASATSAPPVTTEMNSSAKFSRTSVAMVPAVRGANSEGLSSAQLPAAMALTSGVTSSCTG